MYLASLSFFDQINDVFSNLPDINQYCSHCRISVNLQGKDFQDKPWINSICFGNESKQCLFFKVFSSAN